MKLLLGSPTIKCKTTLGNGNGSGRDDGKLAEKIAAIKGKRDCHKALLDELDKTGEDQISLTAPDARAMARMTKVGVCNNTQLAVDVKHKLIAEQEVCNKVCVHYNLDCDSHKTFCSANILRKQHVGQNQENLSRAGRGRLCRAD